MKTCKRGREGGVRSRGSPLAPQSPLSQLQPHPHTEKLFPKGRTEESTHTQLKGAKKRRQQKGHVPSAPGRRRKHGREMKELVLMDKPNPKAPLLAWAARPYPVSGAAFVGHCAPRVSPLSPSALYPSMHPPPAQRAGTGAKLPSECPWGGGVAIFLETGSRLSQEARGGHNNSYHLWAPTRNSTKTICNPYTYVAQYRVLPSCYS